MSFVFISYSNVDEELAIKLDKSLERKKNITVWADFKYIGRKIVDETRNGIERADRFIICLSGSFDSKPPNSWRRKDFRKKILKKIQTPNVTMVTVRFDRNGKIPQELIEKAKKGKIRRSLGSKAIVDLSTKEKFSKNISRLKKLVS